jgi:gluconate 2-dehydrogenase alpha chain
MQRCSSTTRYSIPQGTPLWGSEWKRATSHWFARTLGLAAHSSGTAHRHNYLDLDPTYRDAVGNPLLRMTFDHSENAKKLAAQSAVALNRIAQAAQPTHLSPAKGVASWSVAPYQSTHNTGGTAMGHRRRIPLSS